MAYIRITPERVRLYSGDGTPSPNTALFYKEDIAIVLAQPGVIAGSVARAIVDGVHCDVFIGVTEKDSEGATQRRDQDGDSIGLSCPPFDDPPGGEEI